MCHNLKSFKSRSVISEKREESRRRNTKQKIISMSLKVNAVLMYNANVPKICVILGLFTTFSWKISNA